MSFSLALLGVRVVIKAEKYLGVLVLCTLSTLASRARRGMLNDLVLRSCKTPEKNHSNAKSVTHYKLYTLCCSTPWFYYNLLL